MDDHRNRHAVRLFVSLALGLSLAYWGLFYLHRHHWLGFDPASDAMGALRGYGPTLAALITAAAIYGREGVAAIWKRITQRPIAARLIALAILGPLLASAALVVLAGLAGVDLAPSSDGIPIPKLILIFFFFAVVDGPIGEEIGWRGFLLPRLLERHGPISASFALGLVWFAWHVPLYLATGREELTLAFIASYTLNNVAFSFVHTWFFLRSGGSALLAILLHTAGNYSVYLAVALFPGLKKSALTQPIYLSLLVLAATLAALSMWRADPMRSFTRIRDCRDAHAR